METISNLTTAASKAIWGDSTTKKDNETNGQEPVSGELGNVKAGEPYDKGNADPTLEPKSLTKLSSREVPSADSTADLPSTAAHHPTLTEPVGTEGKHDQKTEAATQAALVNLESSAKKDAVAGTSSSQGDGLVSAKKVGEGEGVHTGVKPDAGAPVSKEPIGVKDASEKTVGSTSDTTATSKVNTTGGDSTTAAATGTSSTTTPAIKDSSSSPRKSTSSNSSVDKDGKKKVSLKDKIKAKLHHHKH